MPYVLPLPPVASYRTLSLSKGGPRIFILCGAGGTGMDDSESFPRKDEESGLAGPFASLSVTGRLLKPPLGGEAASFWHIVFYCDAVRSLVGGPVDSTSGRRPADSSLKRVSRP